MENTPLTRPLRRAKRRLFAKVGGSLLVLAAGGWATYHFTHGAGGADDSTAKAHSAFESNEKLDGDQLKQLFSSAPPKSAEKPSTPDRYTLTSSKSDFSQSPNDRYGSAPIKSVSHEKAKSGAPATALGDRYASVALQPTPAEKPAPVTKPEPTAATEPEPADQEVARGQGPDSFNPLRKSAQPPTTAKLASSPGAPAGSRSLAQAPADRCFFRLE